MLLIYFQNSPNAGWQIVLKLLHFQIYKIRAHKTKPQALLMASFLLMYIALAINILLHQMAPQYVTYGSQNYRVSNRGLYLDLFLQYPIT